MASYTSQFIIIILFTVSIPAMESSTHITLTSSITANSGVTPPWPSPSGDFAFGFRQITGGGFLLAIWFDKIPEKTIVWSANRDNPVPSGSRIHLSAQGNLELFDEKNQIVWSSRNVTKSPVAYAAMLDTGNFVLASDNSSLLWQSFDFPTDTLLPGQKQGKNSVVISGSSELNYSTGRFELRSDGLHVRSFADTRFFYWWEGRDSGGSHLVFDRDDRNGSVVGFWFDGGGVEGDKFWQRLTMDYDGVLRYYVYNKFVDPTGWSVLASIPNDICSGLTPLKYILEFLSTR